MWQPQDAPAIDADALQSLVEMIGADEPAAVLDLLDTYLHDSALQVQELDAAFAGKDYKTVHRMAHSMKSSSATFGALVLSRLCEDLERAAQRECADGACAQRLAALHQEYARVVAALTAERSRFQE